MQAISPKRILFSSGHLVGGTHSIGHASLVPHKNFVEKVELPLGNALEDVGLIAGLRDRRELLCFERSFTRANRFCAAGPALEVSASVFS